MTPGIFGHPDGPGSTTAAPSINRNEELDSYGKSHLSAVAWYPSQSWYLHPSPAQRGRRAIAGTRCPLCAI